MNKTILTADDSATIRQMIVFTLKRADYEVIEAVSGKDALKKLGDSDVAMLITDLDMPEMNEERDHRIPLQMEIFYTTKKAEKLNTWAICI